MNTRDQQIRTWSMLCHISAFASLIIPFGNLLGPLIVWQLKKNELPEIDPHGKESFNFQLTMTIITLIFGAFLFGTLGYSAFSGNVFGLISSGIGLGVTVSLIRIVSMVLVIVAAIKANNGELFHYPSIPFIR
jgi:uncharacterized protein